MAIAFFTVAVRGVVDCDMSTVGVAPNAVIVVMAAKAKRVIFLINLRFYYVNK